MSTIKPNKLDHSAIGPAALSSPSRRRFLIGSAGVAAAGLLAATIAETSDRARRPRKACASHSGCKGMMAGFPAAYFCIKAFSETDQTEDLKKFDVPTLVIQGDDDQIVPFADAGLLQSKLIEGATLKVYKGAPHGLCTTHKDEVSADLLAFAERKEAHKAA